MHGVGEDAHRSDPSERYTSEVVGVARWTRDEPAEPTPHKTVFFSFLRFEKVRFRIPVFVWNP
jgi:hypothetical protein